MTRTNDLVLKETVYVHYAVITCQNLKK